MIIPGWHSCPGGVLMHILRHLTSGTALTHPPVLHPNSTTPRTCPGTFLPSHALYRAGLAPQLSPPPPINGSLRQAHRRCGQAALGGRSTAGDFSNRNARVRLPVSEAKFSTRITRKIFVTQLPPLDRRGGLVGELFDLFSLAIPELGCMHPVF